MLSDFLILELYYGETAALRPLNELLDHYNSAHIEAAITQGDLQCYKPVMGPDRGTLYYRLSAQGRAKAERMIYGPDHVACQQSNSLKESAYENPLYVQV